MLRLNSIVTKAAFVCNKLSRYQHHCTFLKLCLACNVIPVGFNFRFHLAFNIDNVNLNTFCKHSLQHTSKEICNAVLLTSQEKLTFSNRSIDSTGNSCFWDLTMTQLFFYGMALRVKTPIYSTPSKNGKSASGLRLFLLILDWIHPASGIILLQPDVVDVTTTLAGS